MNYKFTPNFYEITELPLPVNGDRTSVNDDGKLRSNSLDLGESNCADGDLPRAVTAADRSSKIREFPGGRLRPRRGPRWS